MKKILVFLILLICIFKMPNTYAASFYESSYIPNIWMNKKNPYDGLTYYNQARFIRESSTNKVAYCIEPFIYFNSGGTYSETTSPTNFTKNQIEDITLIAHFGYGYQNHTEDKWYAITQMMIWEVAEPNANYYFSTTKNGPATSIYNNEKIEIQNLVNNYKKNTSFNNQTYTIVEENNLSLVDKNGILNNFKVISNNATINNNTLNIEYLPIGNHKISLEKNSIIYNRPFLFYQSPTNQDVINLGDPLSNINELTINVINTTLHIEKLDKEIKKPQGDASIAGTVLELYTENNEFIQEIIINETQKTTISNLNFGTYYLMEKTPGKGYNINTEKYYFTLSESQFEAHIKIYNEVIKGTLKIIKEYGSLNNFIPEKNISFNIYNTKNELVKTIVTNEQGIAEMILPYGKYTLKQLTTTEGYQKIEPIEFEITKEETIIKQLKNYKIEVPNTKSNSLLTTIINFIKEILC